MSDSPTSPDQLHETVLEGTLNELGGEPLTGSGFEREPPTNLDEEPAEGDAQ